MVFITLISNYTRHTFMSLLAIRIFLHWSFYLSPLPLVIPKRIQKDETRVEKP